MNNMRPVFNSSIYKRIHMLLMVVVLLAGGAISSQAMAQAVIEGQVTSARDGTPVDGVRITIPGTGYAASTDAEGRYSIEVPAGTYELRANRGGFAMETEGGITLTNGQTVTRSLVLTPEMEQLVVLGRALLEGSTASTLSLQREAMTVTEVSGSEEFSRLGDSTAADTLKRITGLTVEDNKFVVIRGQPLRYTSTLFNGSQLPSLDPIQQVTPLDLFPSGVLSSIAVQKAYTADRQGSFGSGQVQLSSTGLPSEDFFEISGSTAYNSSMDEDGLEFNTGNDRWGTVPAILGLPDPVAAVQDAGTPIFTLSADEQIALGRSFSNELAPGYLSAMGPDGGVSIAAGKRYDTDDGATFGASFTLDYGQKARVELEDNLELNIGGDNELVIRDEYSTSRSKLNTNLGGLLALTAEWFNHRIKSNTFWVRDATEKTVIDEGLFEPSDVEFLRRFLLEYEQRELMMQQFTGHHDFEAIVLDWRLLAANATRELPDRRIFALQNTEDDGSGNWFLDKDATDLIRQFNKVEEDTYSGGVDIGLPLRDIASNDLGVGLKTGFDYDFRERVSDQRQFGFNSTGSAFRPVEEIFAPENFGVDVTFTEFGGISNDYTSEVEIIGGYAQLDFDSLERYRVVAGVRMEDASFKVQTFEAGGVGGATGVESGFETQKFLPSLVGSLSIFDNTQIRAGLTRTISYPATVEVADTAFVDTQTDESFIGNPELRPTIIDSADLRYEWYPSRGEALTIGGFYKDFTDPIERSFLAVGGSTNAAITFDNAEKGKVYGVEFNSYFGLDTILGYLRQDYSSEWISNINVGLNFSLQDSEIEQAADTSATNPVRRMTGQPDNTINLQIGYTGPEHIFTVKFGRVGNRLITAGTEGVPDEFLDPRHDLGFKWSWSPMAWPVLEPMTISLEVENLLDDSYDRTQGDFTVRSYQTGVTAKLGLKYRFDPF